MGGCVGGNGGLEYKRLQNGATNKHTKRRNAAEIKKREVRWIFFLRKKEAMVVVTEQKRKKTPRYENEHLEKLEKFVKWKKKNEEVPKQAW